MWAPSGRVALNAAGGERASLSSHTSGREDRLGLTLPGTAVCCQEPGPVNTFLSVGGEAAQHDLDPWKDSGGLVLSSGDAVFRAIVPVGPKDRELAVFLRERFEGDTSAG